MLFCSATVFAQTPTELTQENFVSEITENPSGDFILTEDISLGDLETVSSAIIPTFSGTLNGNGSMITYTSEAADVGSNFGLFGSVSGTITNLNISASVTITMTNATGSDSEKPIGLLCGELNGGTIQNCNVINSMINSLVTASNGKGIYCGLLVGAMKGTARLLYCTSSGNVVANGSVGGLVGAALDNSVIKACYFSGSVTGTLVDSHDKPDAVGGICGEASANTQISFCCVDATIDGQVNECGIVCGTPKNNDAGAKENPDVDYVYAGGTVNGDVINSSSEVTNSGASNTGLYFEGYEGMSAQEIVDALNAAIPAEEQGKFYFDVIDGHVVLVIGQRVCKTPSNLQVSVADNTATITWDAPAGATRFEVTITSTEGTNTNTTTTDVMTREYQLSVTPGIYYEVSVRTKCGDNFYSDAFVYAFDFDVDCIVNVSVNDSNITYNSAVANITANGTYTYTLEGGNGTIEEVSAGQLNLTGLAEATNYTLTINASCGSNSVVNFTTKRLNFETERSGEFHVASTWFGGEVPKGTANIKINEGHIVTLHKTLNINNNYQIVENKGVLAVYNDAQLINTTSTNVPGIVEIVALNNELTGIWYFIGAPFENNYNLGTILPVTGSDISVSKYDYAEANWSDSWADVYTTMSAGEGYFAWPFYNGSTVFTTYGDVCTWDNDKQEWVRNNYNFNRQTTATKLNNADFTIKRTIKASPNNGGYWMALTNPYPAKLSVSKFLSQNSGIQGNCTYRLNGTTWEIQNATSGDIELAEGFFLNVVSAGEKEINFSKTQLTDYPTAKSQVAPREFVELSLVKGNYNSKLYFAHNQEAEQNYDIFDANKLFALGEVAEPYFVTDGIALVKEEVKELPYYATMNVRSFANDTVSFVVNNIPEGLAVSIIDGENVIDMVEGGVYTTEILTGENADRFKVLIKKNLGIADVEELEVNITNNNRHISIETTETDLQVEVYNALGQKVLSTKDRNFTLNQVSAGAYLIKAFNNKASKTQKIVVE